MEITITQAKRDDFLAIQKLNHQLFVNEYDRYDTSLNCDWPMSEVGKAYFIRSIEKEDSLTLIAKEDGAAIGYLIGTIRERELHARNIGKTAELDNIFISQSHRNTGLGSELVKKLTEWAQENNVENMKVNVESRNTDAIRFYKQEGFTNYLTTLEMTLPKLK